jgi:pimeloyl-ACP methyl ester carboxylesterase
MHPSLGRGADDFKDLAGRLMQAGYQAVAINPRGIGRSKGPLDGATLHDLAGDVWAVADELHLDKAHLLGHAFGNRVARMASADKPGRVLSLTLLAAGGEVRPGKDVEETVARCFDPKLSPEDHLGAVRKAFFAPGNDSRPWRDGWHGETARAQVAAMSRTPLKEWYGGGTAPLLVVQGLDDVVAPPVNAWNLITRRKNARLVALPGCGHALLPEQPRAVADAVVSFLKE